MLKYFLPVLFGVLCAGAMFVNSGSFTDSAILPKWLFTLAGLAGIGTMLSHFLFFEKKMNCCFRTVNEIIIGLCLLQALYGMLQFVGICSSFSSSHRVTGSFDNPAGFAACLCIGFPLCLYFLRHESGKKVQCLVGGILLVMCLAIFLSESRAGWLCIILVGIISFINKTMHYCCRRKHVWKLSAGLPIVLLVVISLCYIAYHLKKDSADGRLLIWQCALEMIKDRPVLGHGVGAFQAKYMDYQAKYFEMHPDSRFISLADNVKHPFNEYLSIGVQFGGMGWVILIAMVIFVCYCYNKNSSLEGYVALLVLFSIGMFSFFSYPFTYPFTWIMAIWCIVILVWKAFGYDMEREIRFSATARKTVSVCLLSASLFVFYVIGKRTVAELEWGHLSRISLRGQSQVILLDYQRLMRELGKEPYFLYNYAAELYMRGRVREGLDVANICRRYWADYDLELLQAESYIILKQYRQAEAHLRKAANMCPVRFVPLYRWHHVCKELSEKERADSLTRVIISKPVKIPSAFIQKIKEEMKEYLVVSQ